MLIRLQPGDRESSPSRTAWVGGAVPILCLVVVHGLFWSGLLSSSAAYMTDLIPESRRAEGIGTGASRRSRPSRSRRRGFWIYARGWLWLCAPSAALNLADGRHPRPRCTRSGKGPPSSERFFTRRLLEWRCSRSR
jgi:hypothetical protein